MSDTDFYNRNMYRNYPFVDYDPYVLSSDMPQEVIVDFGVVFLPGAGFDPDNEDHKIHGSVASSAAVGVIIDAPGTPVDGESLGATTLSPKKYDVHPFTLVVSGETLAFGFIVLGDLSNRPFFPSAVVIGSTTPFVERRCIQVLEGHYVNKLNLANEPRTIATPKCPEGSSSSSLEATSSDYQYPPGGQDMVGDLKFREGYNTDIAVVVSANAIRFSARRGSGEGEACEEIPRTLEEQQRLDSGLTLDRAARCDEVFNNINGVSPDPSGNFSLVARRGVSITSPSANHILIAGRDDLEDCTP